MWGTAAPATRARRGAASAAWTYASTARGTGRPALPCKSDTTPRARGCGRSPVILSWDHRRCAAVDVLLSVRRHPQREAAAERRAAVDAEPVDVSHGRVRPLLERVGLPGAACGEVLSDRLDENVVGTVELVGRPSDVAPLRRHGADPRARRRLAGPDQGQPWKSATHSHTGVRPFSVHQFHFGRVSPTTAVHSTLGAGCRHFVPDRERT